jgi:hypothetical protein
VTGWLSSFAAMQRLREAAVVDPVSTLTQLAEARQLRARAAWGRFADDEGDDRQFPLEPEVDPCSGEVLPWPDIPADFWRWVNGKGDRTEVHGEAGVFAATVIYDPKIGSYSDSQYIKLFGVTFHQDDLEAALRGKSALHNTPALPVPTRSPAGRKPELERWAEFGAALALVVYRGEKDAFKSQSALYAAVAGELTAASREPLSQRAVKNMVSQAWLWIDGEAIPPLPPEA